MKTAQAVKVKLEAVERYERDVKLRLPFRFGVITMTEATQAVLRARISLADGRRGTGVAAETLAPKWFDKDARPLRRAERRAVAPVDRSRRGPLPRARPAPPHLRFSPTPIDDQLARGAALRLNPLVASYGPALLDRAIIDALGRIVGRSFADLIRANAGGYRGKRAYAGPARLRPRAVSGRPGARGRYRCAAHRRSSRSDHRRRSDRRPASRRWAARDVGGSRAPLWLPLLQAQGRRQRSGRSRPADTHRRRARPRRRRLPRDARRQRAIRRCRRHRRAVAAHDRDPGAGSGSSTQSSSSSSRSSARSRSRARSRRWRARARSSSTNRTASSSSFPAALALGYAGVSSKNCKGFYKSLLNAARVSEAQRRGRRARATSCRARTSPPGPGPACSRISRWSRCSGSPMSSATAIISSTA